jgi:hypothetical protein
VSLITKTKLGLSVDDRSVQKMNLHYVNLQFRSTMTIFVHYGITWSVVELAHMLVLLVEYEM